MRAEAGELEEQEEEERSRKNVFQMQKCFVCGDLQLTSDLYYTEYAQLALTSRGVVKLFPLLPVI